MAEKDIQGDAISTWMNKNDLEKVLSIGMYGPPGLKHDEKIYYLGEFKERVINLLTSYLAPLRNLSLIPK